MKRSVRKFKVIGSTMYLNDGSTIPLNIAGTPLHSNYQHTDTFITQTEIDNSINSHGQAFNHRYTFEDYDTDTTLDSDAFRKIHRMDVSGGNRIFFLPDVSTGYQGEWLILVRKGVANNLLIQPVGTDVIFNSDVFPSGGLECSDASHNYSSILLVVMDDKVWGTPNFGIWSTK